jgi:lysophospholipase L1-like esterase
MYRSGSPVSAWVKSGKSKDPSGDGKWGFVDSALKSHKPELIIICLGGNGVGAGNPTKLIKKIRGVSANSKILWIGPPPASVATNEKRAKASFPKAFRENGKNWAVATRAPGRIKKANLIESEIGNMPNVSYVNTPKVLPNYPNNPGPGTDGIHMSANGAIQLLNKIKTTASPAAAGSATPDKAQQKPKHSNKAAPPGSGASDPNNPMSKVWQDSNKELLLKIFEKENQKWNNLQAATNYIKDKSKAWGEEEGKTEVYDSYNNRDWISGYLMEDGHVKAMSVDVSVWQPVRTEELIAWMNFTTKPSTKIPKDPYGPEVFLASYVPANQNQSTDTTLNPMGDWPETQAIIKAESYSMAAAAYMVATGGEQQPNPATAAPVAAGQDPPCPQPMGNAGGGGTFDPSGPIQLPPDGIHTFIPLIEDAINNAVSLVAPLNIGIPADQLKLYLRASCMVESGGKINAINKFGYSGLWQWGGTAWKEGSRKGTGRLYKQATGKSPPPFIRDYNYALSPYIQALMTACAVASKVKTLKKVGAPVIAQHIYMIHNQGAGGFSNIWRRMKTSNQWGGTLAKGGDGDFRRAWANGCGHHGLKKRHAAGQAPTPWLDCRPGTFYKTWTGIWNSKVKKVSKPGKQGGASPNKGYVSRMAHNTNVGQSGFKASLPEADRQRKGQRDARADSPGGPQNGGPSLAGANIPAGGQWRKS